MSPKHLIRAILWIKELLITLLIFWIKNPKETPAILTFLKEKSFASPRFFSRNVLTEKHTQSFEKTLSELPILYEKFSKEFNPESVNSYQNLEKFLSTKQHILYFLVRKLKPKLFVETGVAAGESTGFILKAMADNDLGKLYSIDLPFQWYVYGDHKLHLDSLPAGKIPGYLVPKKLRKNWKLILGNTYEKLPLLLQELGQVDIFMHDSEHSDKTMMFEYEASWPYIKNAGYLLSDDIDFTKAFNLFAKKKNLKTLRFKDLGVAKK